MNVAPAPLPPAGDDLLRPGLGQVGNQHAAVFVALFEDHGPHRHLEHQVAAPLPLLLLPLALAAVARPVQPVAFEDAQTGKAGVGGNDNITPRPTVAPVRTAERGILLMAEGDRTVTPAACFYSYFGFIKHWSFPAVLL